MDNTPNRWTINLLWIHAAWYLAIALACYISPEKVFGDSAWLPLARLAVLLFAAALTTMAIMLAGSAWSGSLSQIRTALLATFLLDVQAPILMFSQPASLEHLQADVGIPWFAVPLTFIVLVGLTTHCFLRLRSKAAEAQVTR